MTQNSKIEWTDHTFNPWIGCQKVSPGCDNCYAEAMMADRWKKVQWGPGAERVRTSPANWRAPLAWNAAHAEFFAKHGRRQRVFCASLADVFDNAVSEDWRADLFDLIAATPNLDWLLLTKRIGNVEGMVPYDWTCLRRGWPVNIWLGASIVNQAEADRDIPKLLAVPARVRFLSMEPLLGPVDLRNVEVPKEHDQLRRPWDYQGYKFNALQDHDDDRFHQPPSTIDWVIVGGESGRGARPMHPAWARSLRDQCAAAGVPFLFKQWGEWAPGECAQNTLDMRAVQTADWFVDSWQFDTIRGDSEFHVDDEPTVYRAGKRAAGRLLDRVQHDGFPRGAA